MKYPKIRTLGHRENEDIFAVDNQICVVTEKVDGTNFRFWLDDNLNFVFGGRNQELDTPELAKGYTRAIEYILNKFEDWPKENLRTMRNMIFFGEFMRKHKINYEFDLIPPVIIFDIFHKKEQRFLPYAENRKLVTFFGLDFIEVIDSGPAIEVKKRLDKYFGTSVYGKVEREGFVIKNYESQIFAKVVRDGFHEEKIVKPGKEYNDLWIIDKWGTEARIDKFLYEIAEGGDLSKKLISPVARAVYNDIWEEHWQDIAAGDRLNPKECLSHVHKLVAQRINQLLMENVK